MEKVVIDINSESEVSLLVNKCEMCYEKSVENVVSKINDTENLKIITLAGPTCSGKTTTAHKLKEKLNILGKNLKVISIDDFYRDRGYAVNADGIPDYETVAAIDLELLEKTVKELFGNSIVKLPRFDFFNKKRFYEDGFIPDNKCIYIFEGIQALYPEVKNILEKYNSKSIFINVAEIIEVSGIEFKGQEIRFIRRVIRDSKFRDALPSLTCSLWSAVRENEEKNIFPNTVYVDYKINSLLGYEVYFAKNMFLSLVNDINENTACYDLVKSLTERLIQLPDINISLNLIPEDSLYREFIG